MLEYLNGIPICKPSGRILSGKQKVFNRAQILASELEMQRNFRCQFGNAGRVFLSEALPRTLVQACAGCIRELPVKDLPVERMNELVLRGRVFNARFLNTYRTNKLLFSR